ncbi:hypothetical protein ACWTU6_30150 [Mesorhizobium sp. BHbsci]
MAVPLGMHLSILFPEDEQSDAGLLELDRKIGPVRLGAPPRVPCLTQLRLKSLCSSASSVSSPGNRQLSPTAAARCRLSCTVLRAIPNMTAISRELVPLPASRSICLNCLIVSLLFAGIKISPFTAGRLMPKLLTQELIFIAENWPVFDRNGGRLQIGIAAGV